MTLAERDERIRAALCEDSPIDLAEQLALVGRLVLRERGLSQLGTEGEPALAEHHVCDKCLHEYDEDGFCEMCGRQRRMR